MSFLGVITSGFFLLVAVCLRCGFALGRGARREARTKEAPWDLVGAAALLEAELETFRSALDAARAKGPLPGGPGWLKVGSSSAARISCGWPRASTGGRW